MARRSSASEATVCLCTPSFNERVYTRPTFDLAESIGRLILADVPEDLRASRREGFGIVLGTLITRFNLESSTGDGLEFYLIKHSNGHVGAYLPSEVGDPPLSVLNAPQDVTISVVVMPAELT